MQVTHDAAGLIFTMSAHGRDISFNICRKADLVETAYIRRGDNKDNFSYMSLTNLVQQDGFNAVKGIHGEVWKDANHSELMLEAAEWLAQVDGIEHNEFYQQHFAHLVA